MRIDVKVIVKSNYVDHYMINDHLRIDSWELVMKRLVSLIQYNDYVVISSDTPDFNLTTELTAQDIVFAHFMQLCKDAGGLSTESVFDYMNQIVNLRNK